DIELGFPVASALSGDARVSADVLPAGRYASLVYTGDYAGLVGANAALLDWGAEKGLVWDSWAAEGGDGFGARFESYLTDPATDPDPAKWETEVAIRLADDQPRQERVSGEGEALTQASSGPEARVCGGDLLDAFERTRSAELSAAPRL